MTDLEKQIEERVLRVEMMNHEPPQESKYLIWSEEHGAWWKPGQWGYTHFLTMAGRYSKAEADEICAKGNKEIHSDSGFLAERTFNEIAIPDPLAS